MATDIPAIAQLLETSLIPQHNKEAERSLQLAETQPGFALKLLQLVAVADGYPMSTRLAGALYFKNFLGRNWTDEDGKYRLPESDVVAIKQEIVGLMITVPPTLQVQLGEAVSIIAESDFYQRWDTLIDDLVSRLTPDNTEVNNGVLQVAHAIFKRWRPLFRSDELFTEINHVLGKFTQPFLTLFNSTDVLITQHKDNKQALQGLMQTLNLIIKISYDLNCQDLGPIFEEHLPSIMAIFHKYLTYSNPLLDTDDEDEAGPVERVKAGICELLELFANKYEDVFNPLLQNFVASTWQLLANLGPESKYDILVSKALQFLTAVAKAREHAENFSRPEVLNEVVEKIILPNMSLRTSDEELFEDDPIEYIRRDLEGADTDTRRRAAADFLRQLLEHLDKIVTDVVWKYVAAYLEQYGRNPRENWRAKDTALYLFTAIAAKGATERQGVIRTNLNVDVVDFFQKNVAADLLAPFDDVHPILKVDAIKYLYTFRSQLTKDQLTSAFPLLAKHLASPNYVVHTYTAVTVDRLLAITIDGVPVFTPESASTFAKDLLEQLFALIEKGGTPEKIAENEFLMRCVMRILLVSRGGTGQLPDYVLGELLKILAQISKNPSNPRFNHYTFESLGAIIRFTAVQQPEKLETVLYEPLMVILGNDVTEFIPYVFQLLSLLLESNPTAPLGENWKNLVGPLMTPTLWESRGNVPALVRLLQAIMGRGSSTFIEKNHLVPVLGIFQKLVSSKITEVYAFDLLEACFLNFPMNALQPYLKDIIIILLTRLNSSKTENLSQRFVRLVYFLAGRDDKGAGPDFVAKVIDQVQPGVFGQVYAAVVLPDTQKLQMRPADRQVVIAGLTKFVAFSEDLATTNRRAWPRSVYELLKMLEIPPVPVQEDAVAEIQGADIDEMSFGSTFARLNTCKRKAPEMFPELADPRKWVGEKLKEADAKFGGRVSQWANAGELTPEAAAQLKAYMQL